MYRVPSYRLLHGRNRQRETPTGPKARVEVNMLTAAFPPYHYDPYSRSFTAALTQQCALRERSPELIRLDIGLRCWTTRINQIQVIGLCLSPTMTDQVE